MKREILFRGKRKDGGIWLFGDLRQWSKTRKGICDYALKNTSEVDPKTVGQFTGLTDKNSTKIFEGDIIHAHYANAPKADFVEQVVFCDGRFCSLFSTIDGSGKMWSALPFSAPHIKNDKSIYMEWCEVIGNIHDNPELLEGGVGNGNL